MLNNKMDDLDHSICIADHDWKCFFEETEECWLLQPLLACPDNWSLSDAEDSGNLSVSVGTDRPEVCQNEGGGSNTVGCCTEHGEISQSHSGGEQENLQAKDKGEGGRSNITAPCAEAVNLQAVESALQVTSVPGTLRTEPLKAPSPDGEETELKKGDGDTQKEGNLSVEELDPLSSRPRELSAGRDVSGVTSRAEKERWFVTVSDNPPRRRARTKATKTKTRQKKSCRKEKKLQSRTKKKTGEGGGEGDEISAGRPCSQRGAGELSPAPDYMLTTDVDCQDTKRTLPSTGSSGLDSEAGDGLGFVSAHSWDSDSFLSAEEECQGSPLGEKSSFDSIVHPAGEAAPHNCGSKDRVPGLPSATRSANKSSECFDHNDAEDSVLAEASAGTPGDECRIPDIPDVTVTPCTVADSPETYAAAAGTYRPVYAISAFWDEMEKLTINDILQLRMGGASPPAGADEAVTPHVDDLAESPRSVVDPAELSLPDAGLMDGSDNADSDYFTQADDSKPDRSSCEFSASDFEEEYWQFLGTSPNPSPDPCPGRDDESSTGSEGRDTPVPPDSSANWSFSSDDPPDRRPILKSKSLRNIQALNPSESCLDSKDESSHLSPDGEKPGGANVTMETEVPSLSVPDTITENDWRQISVLDVPECYSTKDGWTTSRSVIVYDPEDITPVSALRHSFLYTLCCSDIIKEKPVPIFSYSHSTVRDLTFPNYIFLSTESVGDTKTGLGLDIIPGPSSEAPEWFHNWNRLQPMRKIHFPGKGSIWCIGSGARPFSAEDPELCTDTAGMKIPRTDPERISTTCPRTSADLAVQRWISDPLKMSTFELSVDDQIRQR